MFQILPLKSIRKFVSPLVGERLWWLMCTPVPKPLLFSTPGPWHVFLQCRQIITHLCSFWYSDESISHKVHCSSTLDVVTFISLQCRCCNYKEKIASVFQVLPWKKWTPWTCSCISIRLIRRATRRGYSAPVTFSLFSLVPFFFFLQLRSVSPLCLTLLWICTEVLFTYSHAV